MKVCTKNNLVNIIFCKGKCGESMKVLKLDCLNNAIYVYAYMAGGRILDFFENREKALNCYDKAMQYDFHTIRLLKLKGDQLIKLNRYHEALSCYVKIVLINDNDYRSYYNIAFLLYKTYKSEYALNILRKCLEINNNYYRAYILMAMIMYDDKNFEKAILFSEKAIKIQPDNFKAYEIRNSALMALGAVCEEQNSESELEEINYYENYVEEYSKDDLNTSLFIVNKVFI
ncbi:MAG: hypothetical protein K0R54_1232 [Clostridiaceae bacterium]|jgi:tetratricopeptide (TPR) repeat protein|nr:hypothetical protein [Clostridiaceae bacterium]